MGWMSLMGCGRPPSSTLLSGLVAYYKLEEASGTRVDATGQGNDLTPINTPGNAPGIQGNALNTVSASSQYLSRGTHTLHSGGASFSTAGWIYITNNIASDMGLWGVWPDGTHSEWLVELYNRAVYWNAANTVPTFAEAITATITLNTWHHVYAQYDSSNNQAGVSLDNTALVTVALTGPVRQTGGEFRIGNYNIIFSDARIDEVSFWNRLLTTTERTNLYNGGAGQTYPFTGVP